MPERRSIIGLLAAGMIAIVLASPAGAAHGGHGHDKHDHDKHDHRAHDHGGHGRDKHDHGGHDHGGPNQGAPRHVLTVDDASVECDAVPSPKLHGERPGRFVQVRSQDPIDRVTVKSGGRASIIRSRAGDADGMYWMTIELSKRVGDYVVWTCASPDRPARPAVPDATGLGAPITFEAAWDCTDPVSLGPVKDVGIGGSAEISATDPIDRVTLVAGEGAGVLDTDFGYRAGHYWVTLELSEDIASYEVWSCPDNEVLPRAAEPDAGPLAGAIADGIPVAQALGARFPTMVADVPVEISTFSAEAWLATGSSGTLAEEVAGGRALQALADAADLSIDDIAVATGLLEPTPGNHAVIAAVGLPGADAQDLVDQVISVMLGDVVEPRTVPESLAGKVVLRVTDAATPGAYPRNVYVDGDIVWLIEADDPLRTEIAAALP